jgi:hypothetical protein
MASCERRCRPDPWDVFACRLGNAEACRRVYFAQYVCPRICRIIDELQFERPWPWPPWPPVLRETPELRPDEIQSQLGEIVDLLQVQVLTQQLGPVDQERLRKHEVQALTEFRDKFQEMVNEIDEEIQQRG